MSRYLMSHTSSTTLLCEWFNCGEKTNLYVVDNSIPYLSKLHLPYFILALTMSFVFNIIPLLLLCLYPCRCFQTCLNRTGLQHHALHTFMDAFHGCYRHKPYDLRYFSGIYLPTQILNLVIFYLEGPCTQ